MTTAITTISVPPPKTRIQHLAIRKAEQVLLSTLHLYMFELIDDKLKQDFKGHIEREFSAYSVINFVSCSVRFHHNKIVTVLQYTLKPSSVLHETALTFEW